MSDLDSSCIFCREMFIPPQRVPYLMPCSHSICTQCLQKSYSDRLNYVICPRDLQRNKITDLKTNSSTRKAIERLSKQHKVFNQNNQLFCIQSLSKHFQTSLQAKSKGKVQLKELIERIIKNQINRLNKIHQQITEEIEGPFQKVRQWKNMVKEYLSSLRSTDRSRWANEISNELGYYIEEGRRIKDDLGQYQSLDFRQIANTIAVNPSICLRQQFTLQQYIRQPAQCCEIDKDQRDNFDKENTFKKFDFKSKIEKSTSMKDNFQTSEYQEDKLSKSDCLKLNQLLTIRVNDQKQQRQALKEISHNQEDGRLFIYTPSEVTQEKPDMFSQQILLTEKEQKRKESRMTKGHQKQEWLPERINFLQQWQVSKYLPIESIQIEHREPLNLDKQRNAYIRKMQMLKVQEAMEQTLFHNGSWQLINYSVAEMDLSLYLSHCDWQNVQVIKFVKTNLSDAQLNDLLNYTFHSKVNTLVLSGNNLSQASLDALLNYTRMTSTLKNVYISKNSINTLKGHTREKVSLLRQNGINLYI